MITQQRFNWRSLAGGEIAPEMYGRLDLAKNQTGVERCYNFTVTPQGAALNRAGTKFINPTKNSDEAWLMPFVRSDGQGFLLEFGENYIRIHLAGGTLSVDASSVVVASLDVDGTSPALFTTSGSHGFVVDDPVLIRKFQLENADSLGTYALNSYQNRELRINTAPSGTTFTLKTIDGVPITMAELFASPYNGLFIMGNVQDASALTALEMATNYTYSHARQLSNAQFVNDLALAHRNYPPAFVRRTDDQTWAFANTAFNVTLDSPVNLVVTPNLITAMDPGDPLITWTYAVSALVQEGAESGPSLSATGDNILRIVGNFNELTWDPVGGAFRYNIYKASQQGALGFIGSATGEAFTDDNINPDFLTQPPEVLTSFGSTDNYPAVVAFLQQRCIFANTNTDPQSFWVSGLAGFGYFKASFPPQDDQSFTYELSSQKSAPIQHAKALKDVLFFTTAGVFRVFTPNGGPFTPTTVDAVVVNANGAAPNVEPQEMGTAILFPIERGSHVFAMKYDGASDGYGADDLSIIAPHLIEDYTWVQTAVSRAPYPVWWGLRSDGVLIGITYISEQQVFAWHQHELPGGFIESIASVPEGKHDALYLVVRREIASTTVRYIERIEPRFSRRAVQADAYFVDCGITYRGAATDTVTGLTHLEGEDVVVLADGRPLGPYTVSGGSITIDEEAEVIHVGLAYVSEITTLPLVYEMAAMGVGVEKNISEVHMRVQRSAGLEAGADYDHLRPMVSPVDELLGDTPTLRDGVHTIKIDEDWQVDAQVCIRQSLPLPAAITGLAVDFVGAE